MSGFWLTVDVLQWLELERYIADRAPTDGVRKAKHHQSAELEQLARKGSSRS